MSSQVPGNLRSKGAPTSRAKQNHRVFSNDGLCFPTAMYQKYEGLTYRKNVKRKRNNMTSTMSCDPDCVNSSSVKRSKLLDDSPFTNEGRRSPECGKNRSSRSQKTSRSPSPISPLSENDQQRIPQRIRAKIKKSRNDTRRYRIIVLPNGLTTLLVSDLTEDEAILFGIDEYYHDDASDVDSEDNVSDNDVEETEQEDAETDDENSKNTAGKIDNWIKLVMRNDENNFPMETDNDENSDDEANKDDLNDNTDEDDEDGEAEAKEITFKCANNSTQSQDEMLDGLMASAALCVSTGSLHDPPDIPGLAHFLEHMVFMGSEKYPNEDDFDKFITKHGGRTNAFTEHERTVFFFDVARKHFRETLDRFAQFFICPLLKQDSVDREIQTLDSEFRMSMPKDNNRKQQLLSSVSSHDHPLNKFMWGNTETLKTIPAQKGIDVYERLKNFHRKMYSSHYMTLVVHAKAPLTTLARWVTEIFSKIPNNGESRPTLYSTIDPFPKTEFHKLYKVVPVRDIHQVEVTWSLPSLLRHLYRQKPLYYISWLIDHGGKGGLLSCLKRNCWGSCVISSSGEGGFEQNETCYIYSITVTLTDDGLKQFYYVLNAVFEYIQMVRLQGPKREIFEEIKQIEYNDFRWQESGEPIDYVKELCEDMMIYPPKEVLRGNHLLYEYNPALINECLHMLRPEKANIMLSSKSFENDEGCNSKEKWYGTKYGVFDIDAMWEKKWKNIDFLQSTHGFSLPKPNEFIATNFRLVDVDYCPERVYQNPELIVETGSCRLWYKVDRIFEVPKGYIFINLISPIVNRNSLTMALFDVFVQLVCANVTEKAYPAEVAQLEYAFHPSPKGLHIKINGFSHKLPKLYEYIIDSISNFTAKETRFKMVVEQLGRGYHNGSLKPCILSNELLKAVFYQTSHMSIDRQEALSAVDAEMVKCFADNFKKSLFVEMYVTGNFTPEDASSFMEYFQNNIQSNLENDEIPKPLLMKLPEEDTYLQIKSLNERDSGSVIVNVYQFGPASMRDIVINEFVELLIEEPCFGFLRTKEQLGYHVAAKHHLRNGIIALSVCVETQADKFTADHVDTKIEEFNKYFYQKLENMSADEFQENLDAQIAAKRSEDTNMGEEADRLWSEIDKQLYVFDRLDREIEELQSVTLSEVCNYFHALILGHTRKKIGIYIVGSDIEHALQESDLDLNTSCFPLRQKTNGKENISDVELLDIKTVEEFKICAHKNLKYIAPSKKNHISNLEEFKAALETYMAHFP